MTTLTCAEPSTPRKVGGSAKKLLSGFLRRRGSGKRSSDGGDTSPRSPPNSARVRLLRCLGCKHCCLPCSHADPAVCSMGLCQVCLYLTCTTLPQLKTPAAPVLQQAPRASQWASPQKPSGKTPQTLPHKGSGSTSGSAAATNGLAHVPPRRPQLAAISAGPVSGHRSCRTSCLLKTDLSNLLMQTSAATLHYNI